MPFDHTAAIAQINSNVQYAGVDLTLSGVAASFKGMITEEQGSASLGDHGYTESLQAAVTVSHADFPQAPPFGATLTVVADGRRYRVRHSQRNKAGWLVDLEALDLSTPSTDNQFPV